jgi:hypothetical protein
MKYKLIFILLFLFSYCGRSSIDLQTLEQFKQSVQKDSSKFDFETKISELQNKLSTEFVYKTNSCFLIVSNLTENETGKIINHTIVSAEECFYNDFFEIKPNEIITIFLFKDDKTYRNWAYKLYGDDDLSPYGYYKPSKKVMLMNINTGSGTLVHEMTHAFVRYDFPDIPSWFNEGLGSLYERCSIDNGEILGYVNWRLPSLQNAINDGSYTTLEELFKTNDDEFYGENSGFNYSQARYFCLYMQEKGLLKKFYKAFRTGVSKDPTGIAFAEELFGKKLKEIDKTFLIWAEKLKYE